MPKTRLKSDPEIEDRIINDIVVDAYDEDERALSWYYYLQNQLRIPFKAICIENRPISPLRVKDKVEVIGMPGEDECEREIFVTIRWEQRELAVPLSQLKPAGRTDDDTQQAIEDWHYWVEVGYRF